MKNTFYLTFLVALTLLPFNLYAAKKPAAYTTTVYSNQLKNDADKGNSEAQYVLGRVLALGHGAPTDRAQAFSLFEKSANQGNPLGKFALGECYSEGWSVRVDNSKAEQIYKECLKDLKKLADDGNSLAMAAMGRAYRYGYGVKQKNSDAFKWLKKAAEAGDASAMVDLGYFYEKELGTTKNMDLANKWYLNGAEAGDLRGMHYIALDYYFGTGIQKDYYEAFKWFKKAASQGYKDSYVFCGFCYEDGEGVSVDSITAYQYYQKGADLGNSTCLSKIGGAYAEGLAGFPVDKEKAISCLEKAIDAGNNSAMIKLGDIYRVDCNFIDAYKCYSAALEKDPDNQPLRELVAMTEEMIKTIRTRLIRYETIMNRVEDKGDSYDDSYAPKYFMSCIKKNGAVGYNFDVPRYVIVDGDAYGYPLQVKDLTNHPTAELKGAVTKSGITLTYYDDCQLESSFNQRTGQPKAPADPYKEAYECTTGSKTGEAVIYLKSEYLSKPNSKGQVFSHYVMLANTTRTCKHTSFKFNIDRFPPYKFKHTATVKLNFDEMARKNNITKEEVVMGLMSGVIAIKYPGTGLIMRMTPAENICLFYSLAKTFGITREMWNKYVMDQYTDPNIIQADEDKYYN